MMTPIISPSSLGRFAAGALFALAVLFFGFAALAAELPALTGRVVDNANIIDPAAEAALTQKLADFETKGSDQIVVATIPSLDGEEIEPYANRLFRFWKLGQAKENNGVLLLVAPNERRVRIEVGYGLEKTLSDPRARAIIDRDILPAFRAGNLPGGIIAGAAGITQTLEPAGAKAT